MSALKIILCVLLAMHKRSKNFKLIKKNHYFILFYTFSDGCKVDGHSMCVCVFGMHEELVLKRRVLSGLPL